MAIHKLGCAPFLAPPSFLLQPAPCFRAGSTPSKISRIMKKSVAEGKNPWPRGPAFSATRLFQQLYILLSVLLSTVFRPGSPGSRRPIALFQLHVATRSDDQNAIKFQNSTASHPPKTINAPWATQPSINRCSKPTSTNSSQVQNRYSKLDKGERLKHTCKPSLAQLQTRANASCTAP